MSVLGNSPLDILVIFITSDPLIDLPRRTGIKSNVAVSQAFSIFKYGDVYVGIAYLHMNVKESEVSPCAVPAMHLVSHTSRKCHKVNVPHLNRFTTAYHVAFQESSFLEVDYDGVGHLPRKERRIRNTGQ